MSAHRCGATGTEDSEKHALCRCLRAGFGIVDRRQEGEDALVVGATLHSESTLTRRREHRVRLQPLRHRVLEPETKDTRSCKHHRIELPVLHLSDARVDVPANRADVEVVAHAQELRGAAQAARPDDRTRRELAADRGRLARRRSP